MSEIYEDAIADLAAEQMDMEAIGDKVVIRCDSPADARNLLASLVEAVEAYDDEG